MPTDTELHKAAYKGDVKNFREVFEKVNLPIDVQGANGRTPLQRAISVRKVEFAKVLVNEFGADVNCVDLNGSSPLHWAAIINDVEIAKFLVSKGCSVNLQNNKGETALHTAASLGNMDIIRYLHSLPEVDKSLLNKNQETAYDLSRKEYNRSRKAGANHKANMKLLKVQNKRKWTLFRWSPFAKCT